MVILGIESSADETAAAVVEDGCRLLSNTVASSLDLHTAFGGIVPEIAARSHLEVITPVIQQALEGAFPPNKNNPESGIEKSEVNFPDSRFPIPDSGDLWSQIDAIAVTQGPGLGGSLLIGVLTARTLAIAKNKPLHAVNHVLAHVYAAFITKTTPSLSPVYRLPSTAPKFPILALIVSGGHTQLALFSSHTSYKILGRTADDAVGEAFDKVAKILGLPYPGGPSVAATAENGNPRAFKFPTAQMENKYDFSFSGLKTAVLRTAQAAVGKDYTLPSVELPGLLTDKQKADIAASFQATATKTLVDKLAVAYNEFQPASVVICGGVAANQALRQAAERRLKTKTEVIFTDIKLCTDNAAMVAARGYYQAVIQQPAADPYSLDIVSSLTM